ncbi:tetratricopeptide repeat protein [Kordiimonas sp. SCSIO 12603]|uniref:tetratricopeptide repeat protein n=1 Tax=Kordiimonas sp. SCSIO 12603 TaxID=2829596 RepID=UPI002103B987|nr:tetratricopeptide repeat protein [Kordiimonas sp. SCSIO 12603]UTW57167.1 tetratricopeptide repeat protein [Kordiimonas sp. SCSIO 12603]
MNTALKSILVATSLALSFGAVAADNIKTLHIRENHQFSKGQNALQAGELSKARNYFKRALRSNLALNYQVAAHNNLCAIGYATGSHDEALKACINALKLDRNFWQAHVNMGNIYKAAGDLEAAETAYKSAHAINPTSQTIQTALSSLQDTRTKQFSENR